MRILARKLTEDQRAAKNLAARERYAADRAAGIERYTPEQREKANAIQRASHNKNKDVNNEKQRKRYVSLKEEILAERREYYLENRNEILERAAIYREENREKRIADHAMWRSKNREKIYELNRNYRALKRGAEGSHTKQDIDRLYDLQNHKCAACSEGLEKTGKNRFHVDHIIALSKDGRNSPDNLQLLCRFCNISKGAKDPLEWARQNGKLL